MTRFLKIYNSFYQKKSIFVATLILLSCILTFVFDRVFAHNNSELEFECESNLKLINPYPDCETYLEKAENFKKLQSELEELVDNLEKKESIVRVAVFSRDMTTRRFVGVNEDDRFFMASLLKVPLMVAWYKLAEVEPTLLDISYTYNGTPDLYSQQQITPRNKLIVGNTYTINELIERAIIYSDNTAAQILSDKLPNEMIDRILRALSIQLEREPGVYENFVTAKTYANVFRVLYNSSYLTRVYSNKGLEILTKSEFKDGMKSIVDRGEVVASKFGERTTNYTDGRIVKQLHECGIVYNRHGKEPYTFCILTEGSDYSELIDAIRAVAKKLYEANE